MGTFKKALHSKIDVFVKFESAIIFMCDRLLNYLRSVLNIISYY